MLLSSSSSLRGYCSGGTWVLNFECVVVEQFYSYGLYL